jgi:recombination protein U
MINWTNAQYKEKKIALVQKIETPIKIIRSGSQIVSAFPVKKSTVDYTGVANGVPIAFEAKETREERFYLKEIKEHQLEFLKLWVINGGLSFVLVNFVLKNEVFFLPLDNLLEYIEVSKTGKRGTKSIPYSDFKSTFPIVKSKNGIVLDYIDVVFFYYKLAV